MVDNLTLEQRIEAFSKLGQLIIHDLDTFESNSESENCTLLNHSIKEAYLYNPWFVKENSIFALRIWAELLTTQKLCSWTIQYPELLNTNTPKWIAVIMAGNIPMVGFHDFLSVLISGHNFLGKLSSDDNKLIPALAAELCSIEPRFKNKIHFADQKIAGFEAVIATGSNNSARYFEFYFGKFKHIIRKNRNGVAVINGNESDLALRKLGIDICLYFGLGCRSVSKLFIPEGFDLSKIYESIQSFAPLMLSHNKYMNNYTYQKSIMQMNGTPYFDNDFLLLVESSGYSSPISVVNYEYYYNINDLKAKLNADAELIQCIVTEIPHVTNSVQPGNTQVPELNDYADGIDTINFLTQV